MDESGWPRKPANSNTALASKMAFASSVTSLISSVAPSFRLPVTVKLTSVLT